MTRRTGAAAETAPSAFNPDDFVVDARRSAPLRTAVVWLVGALVAVTGVVVAARSEQGMARIHALMGKGQPTGVETTEALRSLQAERDRLASRVDSLERMVGDITASIPRDMTARQPAGPVVSVREPPPLVYAPSTIEPAAMETAPPRAAPQASAPPTAGRTTTASAPAAVPPVVAPAPSLSLPGQVAMPQPRPVPTTTVQAPPGAGQPAPLQAPAAAPTDSTALRTEFGVDLGGDTGLDGVRALWVSLRAGQAQALEGLRPMVAVRETARGVEFRLLAGPFENAGGAARLCARLALTGIYCQPTVFDGQRLALR